MEDETPIGAVVMPALVIDHATGRTHEHHPPGGEATAGALWTTNIMTPAGDLPALIEQGVIALDMETAAYAQSCEREGVPWSVHRAISDRATDDSIDDEVFHLTNQDATPNWGNIARYFLKHPQRIPSMVKLAKGSKLATESAVDAAIAAARAARADHSGANTAVTTRSAASDAGPSQVMAPWSSSTTRSHSAERVADVLLDDQQRGAGGAQPVEAQVDLVDDDRRQPERQLVGDEQLGLLHEHAGHGEHPLLAARERAGDLLAPVGERREELEGPLERRWPPRVDLVTPGTRA